MKFTYLFHCPQNGLTKIGRTKFPQQRFRELGGKKKLEVVALIEGDCEGELHKKHSDCREHGEWFSLSESEIASYSEACPDKTLPEKAVEEKKMEIKVQQRIVINPETVPNDLLVTFVRMAEYLGTSVSEAMRIYLVEAAKLQMANSKPEKEAA